MADDIRNQDTIEVLSPYQRQRRRRRLLQAAFAAAVGGLAAAIIAAAIALGAWPRLRQYLAESRPGKRLLTVTSTPPGADVFLDELHLGATPLRELVEPGSYELRVVHSGYKAWREPVDIHCDKALDNITLEPHELATLIVESKPEGAQVLLNRDPRGSTPITIRNIPAGTYTVEIRKARHLPVRREIELRPEQTERIVVQLKSAEERYYIEAIEANPATLSHYTELLHVYILKHDAPKALDVADKALAMLDKAEASATEHRQFFDELTKVLDGKVGPIDDARKGTILDAMLVLLEKTIVADPGEPSHYRAMVAQLGKHGQFSKIKALCDKVAENPNVGARAHTYIAQMFLGWGEIDSGIALLQRAVELRPTYFSARRYLASAYHRGGQLDEALEQYEAAEKLVAKGKTYYQAQVHVGIARILAAKNDVPGALARYKKAFALKLPAGYASYASQWRFLYAQLLASNGRTNDAIAQYRIIEETTRRYKTRALARAARKRLQAGKPSKAPKAEKK